MTSKTHTAHDGGVVPPQLRREAQECGAHAGPALRLCRVARRRGELHHRQLERPPDRQHRTRLAHHRASLAQGLAVRTPLPPVTYRPSRSFGLM